MKKLILLVALLMPLKLLAIDVLTMSPDTIIYVKDRKIEIEDSEDRMKVKIYEQAHSGNYEEMEMVFEGHYKEGRSYEKRKYIGNLTLPIPSWDRHFEAHWVGFGVGFANFSDGDFNFNDVNGVTLRSGKSLEYNLNFLEKSFPFSRYPWAVVTGMGIRWSRYNIEGDVYFKEINGITRLIPWEGGSLRKSKLNMTALTIPVLLEWQKRKGRDTQFFVSAGVVGVIKTISSSRIGYTDERGKKQKEKVDGGLNIHPVSLDLLFQAGISWIGMYAKYSPVELFENSKGPKLYPVSIGLHLHF